MCRIRKEVMRTDRKIECVLSGTDVCLIAENFLIIGRSRWHLLSGLSS